ncbi:MAG: SPOR domain-containing protein [Gammaproteobacteria bacterium]|nr:SPOR domain-containing protein [Gammaproteobacteria bacterium]
MKDYKGSSSKGKSKSKPRGKGRGGSSTPGWVMLVTGLVIGGLVGVGAYLFIKKDGTPQSDTKTAAETKPVSKAQPAESSKSKAEARKSIPEKPRFEFYTLLPEQEVVIPDNEIREQQQRIAEKQSGKYVIQVGSFRHKEDADSLKAKLAFLGVESSIDSVSSNEETWHRVRVGPFTDTREMNRIRNRIHANKMNTLVVKIQG